MCLTDSDHPHLLNSFSLVTRQLPLLTVSTCLIEYNNKGMADCLSSGVSADIPIGITSGHLFPLL